MDLKRILVAVNPLTSRDAAFERALAIARASGAELYLLHAVPVNERFSFAAAERLERMAELRRRAEDAGVRVDTSEQHGDPADIIELHAHARGVDLIVMGGDTPRGWRRRDRSMVAERVIRRTDVPTLIAAGPAADSPSAFRHVLVAVDLSPASTDVLGAAAAVTARQARPMTVLHTVTAVEAADAVQSRGRWIVPEYRTHLLNDARRAVREIVAAVRGSVATRVQVSTGPTAGTILETAADMDADLVVVGRSRGFSILGSTALRVLRRSDRSLLVIPSVTRPHVARQRAA